MVHSAQFGSEHVTMPTAPINTVSKNSIAILVFQYQMGEYSMYSVAYNITISTAYCTLRGHCAKAVSLIPSRRFLREN